MTGRDLRRLGDDLTRRSVCPYARQAWRDDQIQWLRLPAGAGINPIPARHSLYRALEWFLNSQDKVLLFLYCDQFSNHIDAQLAAKRLFLELGIAADRVAAPDRPLQDVLKAWANRLYPYLAQAGLPIEIPLIACKRQHGAIDDTLFVFMANSLYGADHPRHAPAPILVVTYQSDIQAARSDHPEVTDRINTDAVRRILAPFTDPPSGAHLARSDAAKIPHPELPLSMAQSQLLIDRLFRKGLYELPSPALLSGAAVDFKR